MFENYEEFLKDFDNILKLIFDSQKKYIKCQKGCYIWCKKGDYPFSQLEFAYMTQGFIQLNENTKILVQQNIRSLMFDKKEWQKKHKDKNERFEHPCPFLINNECCVYKYRGIICRTFGVCYYDDKNGYVRLPDCVHDGLNYAQYFDPKTSILNIPDVPKINLRIDRVLSSELAQKYNLDYGEIRPMLEWLKG